MIVFDGDDVVVGAIVLGVVATVDRVGSINLSGMVFGIISSYTGILSIIEILNKNAHMIIHCRLVNLLMHANECVLANE